MRRKGGTKIDSESFFRNKIENTLITASWYEEVKETLGLKGVSQVWGEKPAWYFWISHAPGVHCLQMESTSTKKASNGDLFSGVFSVKCYPYPRESVFQSFSFEEQSFIQSNFFDHNNTPRIELKEKIPKTLFNVAVIEYTVDLDENLVLFTFESLDAMRLFYGQEKVQEYTVLKKSKCYRRGEIGRDIPGWDLGYPLFDRLLSLYSFCSKRKPVRLLMTSSPGFKYVYDKTNTFQCVDTGDVKIYSLSVLFASKCGETDLEGIELLEERINGGPKDVIFDQAFQCGHFHNHHDQIPLMTALNEQWWSLAEADYKSELTSTCGCACDDAN